MTRLSVLALFIALALSLRAELQYTPSARAESNVPGAASPSVKVFASQERLGGVRGFVESRHGHDTARVPVQLRSGEGAVLRTTRTDDDGAFDFYPLDAGRYRLRVLDRRGQVLAVENTGALNVALLDGQVLNVSLSLSAAPPQAPAPLAPDAVAATVQITGVVTAADSGLGLAVAVDAYTQDGFFAYSAFTDSEGKYTIPNVVPGSYKLQFLSSVSPYASRWYSNQPDFATATPVVVAGATVPNINAALAVGGQIAGTITAADTGLPFGSATATVFDQNGWIVGFGFANSSGNYTSAGLPSGAYRVRFSTSVSQPYLGVYFANAASFELATLVAVTSPSVTPGINGALPRSVQIAGRVTSSSTGLPIEGASVQIYDCAGRAFGAPSTNAAGMYTTTRRLESGTYRVRFDKSPNYVPQAYNDRPDMASADRLIVTAPGVTANIDAALDPVDASGSITGTVTDASTGLPISGASVTARGVSDSLTFSAIAGASGNYSITGLPSGSYYVSFSAALDYVRQYYNNKIDSTTADQVVVTSPGVVPGINAALQSGGRIDGTVTDGVNPLEGVQVRVLAADGSTVSGATTGFGGFYNTFSVAPGTYRLLFRPGFPSFSQPVFPFGYEYYDNKLDFAAADGVVVSAHLNTSGINATLQPGAHIAAAVTRQNVNGGLLYIGVYNSSGHLVAFPTDSSSGWSVTPALPTGNYKVQFAVDPSMVPACGGPYVSEYYNHKPDLASADWVTVNAPNTTSLQFTLLFRGLFLPSIVR